MSLKDFGTANSPLRASELPLLLRCPRSVVLRHMNAESSGQAADTGSAVHKAIAMFHSRADVAAAIRAMAENLPEYPLADLGLAEQHFRLYARDERNQNCNVIMCEEKIEVSLPPPKGHSEAVKIVGHVDQVRGRGGVLTICDVKTGGAYEGDGMLIHYAAQLMAYQIGVSQKTGNPHVGVCIIRTRDYMKTDRQKRSKPGPVFWTASWTLEDAYRLMDSVRRIVGAVRDGEILTMPSPESCRYCVGGGIANCQNVNIGEEQWARV